MLFSRAQSLSDGAETGMSLREFGPLLVCPKPLFGSSAVGSASGSCCGAVAIEQKGGKNTCENVTSNVDIRYANSFLGYFHTSLYLSYSSFKENLTCIHTSITCQKGSPSTSHHHKHISHSCACSLGMHTPVKQAENSARNNLCLCR